MDIKEIDADVYNEILKKKLKRDDFKLLDGKLEYSSDVKGFHGEHGTVEIRCQVEKEIETFKFFFKGSFLRKELFDKYFSKIQIFEREHYLQSVVLKQLEAIIGRQLTAECYYSRQNKFLVCEDLCERGFERMRVQYADLDHARLALKGQAALHAASMVHEEKAGKSLVDIFPLMAKEHVFRSFKENGNIFSQTSRTLLSHLISLEPFYIEQNQKEAFLDWYDESTTSVMMPAQGKRNAVLHGDTMAFNYLYLYDPDGKPTDCVLVDFQFSRICPPTVDLIMLFSSQMTLQQEATMFKPLVEFYYSVLCEYLSEQHLSPEEILSEKEFRESLEGLKAFGACIRLLYTMFIHLPPEKLSKVLSSPESVFHLLGVGDTQLIEECINECHSFRVLMTDAFYQVHRYFKLSKYFK